jgi:hypothetical protein
MTLELIRMPLIMAHRPVCVNFMKGIDHEYDENPSIKSGLGAKNGSPKKR